jgi:hypothetical protein
MLTLPRVLLRLGILWRIFQHTDAASCARGRDTLTRLEYA